MWLVEENTNHGVKHQPRRAAFCGTPAKAEKKVEGEISLAVLNQVPLSFEKINPDEIEVIKTFNHVKRNTVVLKLHGKGYFVASYTINNILKLLPSSFIKVHNAFIVNKKYINGMIGKTSVRVGDEIISFGSDFKKNSKIEF